MTRIAPTRKQPSERRGGGRIRKIALSGAVLLFAISTLSVTSLALFTDTESVTGNNFNTGTIDLVASPASVVVTMPAMAPGDPGDRAAERGQRRIARTALLDDVDHHRERAGRRAGVDRQERCDHVRRWQLDDRRHDSLRRHPRIGRHPGRPRLHCSRRRSGRPYAHRRRERGPVPQCHPPRWPRPSGRESPPSPASRSTRSRPRTTRSPSDRPRRMLCCCIGV